MPLAASPPRVTPALPWVMVLAGGVIMGLALGVRHAGVFLLPVSMDRGWSRETFAMAMALQNLTWASPSPSPA